MREKPIEQSLVKAVRQMGGMCPKFISPGMDGMPDRMVLLPKGKIVFVEVKAPGKKPRPLQVRRHEQLRKLGFSVFILDDPAAIPTLLEGIVASDCHPERSEAESKDLFQKGSDQP